MKLTVPIKIWYDDTEEDGKNNFFYKTQFICKL
jgi:hypothetical protein